MTRERTALLDAREVAQRLFRERGFGGTSVRDIAREMGIKPGSLYSRIASKEDLLWEIAEGAAERFFAMIEPIVASDRIVMQKLRDIIRGHVQVITDDLDAAAVYSTEWRHLGDERRAAFIEKRDRYEQMITDVVEDGIEQGHFGQYDPKAATLLILSSLNWIYQWYRPEGRMSPDEVGHMMSDFILDGLKRRTV